MIALFCLLGLLAAPAQDAVKARVTMENPTHHYYQVEMTFPAAPGQTRTLRMADWIPGSYRIRDFARNVSDFAASDLDNQPLTWTKSGKSTWVITAPAGSGFKVRYSLFANEFSVRTSYLDRFYGFINPASAFLYEEGGKIRPHEILIVPYNGWAAESGLTQRGANLFLAQDFNHLVDAPFQFGRFRRHDFEVNGLPHHWIIDGDLQIDESAMVESLQRIGVAVGDIFGDFPFKNYYYLTQFTLRDKGSNGLEHRNSTMVQYGSFQLSDKKGWDKFLGLMIHEYFHAWNVKAIRDNTLFDPNLQQEVYTELLWLHEGWTSYYDMQLMGRVGFWNQEDVHREWAAEMEKYQHTPGASRQSLTDASFNAWIHYYQAEDSFVNDRISYYSAGALSGLCLDLIIRHKTKNAKGLDDLMRILYQDYAKQGRGIDWNIVADEVEKLAGAAGAGFLKEHIRQPKLLPLQTALGYAGVRMVYEDEPAEDQQPAQPKDTEQPTSPEADAEQVDATPEAEADAPRADATPAEDAAPVAAAEPESQAAFAFKASPKTAMGITTKVDGNDLKIKEVRLGSAAWRAGLDFDDEIIAINDRRVSPGAFDSLMSWSRPGDEVTLTVSRRGRLLRLPVRLEAKPKKLKLIRDENADSVQNQIYETVFRSAK